MFQESANSAEQLLRAKLDRFEAQEFDNEVPACRCMHSYV